MNAMEHVARGLSAVRDNVLLKEIVATIHVMTAEMLDNHVVLAPQTAALGAVVVRMAFVVAGDSGMTRMCLRKHVLIVVYVLIKKHPPQHKHRPQHRPLRVVVALHQHLVLHRPFR